MLLLQTSHPPQSPRTFLHSLSIGHISYYTPSLSYTSSCLYKHARHRRTQQLFNQHLLFFSTCFLSPLFHAFFLSNIPLCTVMTVLPLANRFTVPFLFPISCLAHKSSQSCAHAHPVRYHCSVRVLCISSQCTRYWCISNAKLSTSLSKDLNRWCSKMWFPKRETEWGAEWRSQSRMWPEFTSLLEPSISSHFVNLTKVVLCQIKQK